MTRCPSCNSPSPHLHPAMQFDGEVEVCGNEFHLQATPQQKPEYIEAYKQKRTPMKTRDTYDRTLLVAEILCVSLSLACTAALGAWAISVVQAFIG